MKHLATTGTGIARKPCYFSQNGEDSLLGRLFSDQSKGFFVDAGAFDGVHLSNTYFFELQGWHGICIEPHPIFYRLCEFSRPNSICLNQVCVADETRRKVDFLADEIGLLSGVDLDISDVQLRYKQRRLRFEGLKKLRVSASTLNAILEKHLPVGQSIDVLSIDVEGYEVEVLKGLDLQRYRPRIMIVEANTKEMEEVLQTVLNPHGYESARHLSQNIIFAHQPEDIARLRKLPLTGESEVQYHPYGETYTVQIHWGTTTERMSDNA